MESTVSLLDQILFWVSVPLLVFGGSFVVYQMAKAILKRGARAHQMSTATEDSGCTESEEIKHSARELLSRVYYRARDIIDYEPSPDSECALCTRAITWEKGNANYGTLYADFGYGAENDGNKYQLNFCEKCFMDALLDFHQKVKRLRGGDKNFDVETHERAKERFGLVHCEMDAMEYSRRVNELCEKIDDSR